MIAKNSFSFIHRERCNNNNKIQQHLQHLQPNILQEYTCHTIMNNGRGRIMKENSCSFVSLLNVILLVSVSFYSQCTFVSCYIIKFTTTAKLHDTSPLIQEQVSPSFTIQKNDSTRHHHHHHRHCNLYNEIGIEKEHDDISSRMGRRTVLSIVFGVVSSSLFVQQQQEIVMVAKAAAATTTTTTDTVTTSTSLKDEIHEAFQIVRNEITDSTNGGIPTLQRYVNQKEYTNILEYTKIYDQILRKQKIGSAKKLFLKYVEDVVDTKQQSQQQRNMKKVYSERITTICNAITFDLIGMNRYARKVTTDDDDDDESNSVINREVQKYLDLLKSDVEQFLVLEQEIL